MRLLLLLSFILIFTSGFLLGYYTGINVYIERVTVYAVAVDDQGNGYVVPINATLSPGSGRIFISVEPKTNVDLQSSAETAVFVAQLLSGKSLGLHDIFFEMKAPAAIVGGPSAGIPLTIAAYSLLTGKTPREDVLSTGVIYPDGSVGEVGHIYEKLRAAAEWGAKVFLIPKGQRFQKVSIPYTTYEEILPGITLVRTKYITKVIDVVEEGKELGVDVIEIENVREAIPYYFS